MSALLKQPCIHVRHSGQRRSTITSSSPWGSHRRGCRRCDPQLGHTLRTATSTKVRRRPDGTEFRRVETRRAGATLGDEAASCPGGAEGFFSSCSPSLCEVALLSPFASRVVALAAAIIGTLVLASASSAAPYSSVTAVGKTGGGVLRFPQAVAYDASGVPDPGAGAPAGPYVYVADQYSFLVQKFTRDGTFVRDWGGFGTGTGRFGNASGDTVGGIGGLAVDGAGRVYVLDSYNDRIQQFTPGGTFQRAWGATGTAPGQFQLGINGGIAIRGSNLFVADQNNHRVQRFTLDSTGAPVGTPAAFGSLGAGEGQLDHPQGIGVDDDAVYVADDRNDRVVRFSHDGAYLGSVGTTGTAGSQFRFPYDAGVDSLGRLYVADNNNHRVQEFDAATFVYRRRWGVLGTAVREFGYPRSLAGVEGDPAGGVFVGDTSNNRIQSFAPDSTSRATFGINARGPGIFMQPKSVAVGKDGALWVADTFSDRVQKLSASGAFVASYSRVSTFGPASGGGAGEFRNPYGVAIDPVSGHLFVADTG